MSPTGRTTLVLLALVGGLGLLVSGFSLRQAAPGPWKLPLTPPAGAQVIVAVGDSITFGLHDRQQAGGWVARLADRLHIDYPGVAFNVVNAGVNGDTAAGVLKRLDHDVLAPKPRLVILSIGTNDFDYGVPTASFRYTLTRVITRLRAADVPVLAVSMLPIAGLSPQKLAAESVYNATISRVAASTGAGYLDEFDRCLALGSAELKRLRDDAEHPNPIGYRLLAGSMAAFLETQYLTPYGQIMDPPDRPSSDLMPGASIDAMTGWQTTAVHTNPNTGVSVVVTTTNGISLTVSGRTDRAGLFVMHNPKLDN